MQGRHEQDASPLAVAFLGVFEPAHLQHHRQGFDDEDAAHDQQHDFLAHDHRHGAQGRAQGQGAHVAHEHLGRIGVEPQEAQAGAAQGAEEHGQLAGARHIGQEQVLGVAGVAGDVGEHRQGRRHHDGGHDGQAVQAVGEVHRVGGADDDEVGQGDEADHAQGIGEGLEEGNDHFGLGRAGGGKPQIDGGRQTEDGLPEELPAGSQAVGVPVHHLLPVVVPAHGAEAQGHHQHHPDVAVGKVAPEQGRDADGDENEDAAHGGGAGLHQMGLGAVGAHRLADLLRRQPADNAGTGDKGDEQGGHGGQHHAQGDVVENVEGPDILAQPLGDQQQHQLFSLEFWLAAGAVRASTTRSIFMKREPFTSTVVSPVSSACTACTRASRFL